MGAAPGQYGRLRSSLKCQIHVVLAGRWHTVIRRPISTARAAKFGLQSLARSHGAAVGGVQRPGRVRAAGHASRSRSPVRDSGILGVSTIWRCWMSPVARAHVIVSVIVLAAAAVLIAVMVTVVTRRAPAPPPRNAGRP